MTDNEVSASICLALGCVLLFWRSRRKFSRLNSYGVEQHSGHLRMLTATGFDFALFCVGTTLLAIAATILMIVEQDEILGFFIALLAAFQFRQPAK